MYRCQVCWTWIYVSEILFSFVDLYMPEELQFVRYSFLCMLDQLPVFRSQIPIFVALLPISGGQIAAHSVSNLHNPA